MVGKNRQTKQNKKLLKEIQIKLILVCCTG